MPVSACVKTCGTCENLWKKPLFYYACSPFYKPKGSSTLSGTPTGGLGDIFDIVHSGALNATDPEIFVVGLRAYLPTGYGL